MKKLIHICPISDQPIPNLVPLLLYKPTLAYFLVSAQSKDNSRRLQRILKPRGIRVIEIEIDPYDFDMVVTKSNDLIKKHEYDELVLNVTAGTKITALATYQSFYFENKKIIYLDTSNDTLLHLSAAEKKEEITGIINVKDYLSAYGLEITNSEQPQYTRQQQENINNLCKFLINNPQTMGKLNYQIGKNKNFVNLSIDEFDNNREELCNLLQSCKIGELTNSCNFNIPDNEKIFFAQGGWLEEYVYNIVKNLKINGISPHINVEVKWDGSGKEPTTNEFDIVFCYKNKLHLISCKTSNLDLHTETSTKGKEAIYELDSLSDVAGGIFGEAMLCSARKLNETSRKRAKMLKLEVVDGTDILQLDRIIKKWLK